MSAAMPAGATALLEVEQIEVAYGKARAVNGATVRVAEGSITAIVGPNGAGKTSLVKAVSGLQAIRAGQIRFRGGRIDTLAERQIAALGIAHVPEGRRVFAKMTVLENEPAHGRLPPRGRRRVRAHPRGGARGVSPAARAPGPAPEASPAASSRCSPSAAR